ncbi:MAG: succinate dehydrogenase, cytochrome b556 subunit [Rhizobiaceae bacterium]|nr:succinate dehydrogenase, cytochrome b556 subunit [Rhizobiaceae bacterium]
MSTQATRARPVSPHLQIYRWTPTMAMSIVHRATGIALYGGMLLVAWWLVAAATSPSWFDFANWLLGSWFGLLVLIGFSWALIHHALGGVRHYVWDTGVGLDKKTATTLSSLTLVGSLLLTAALWAAYYFLL